VCLGHQRKQARRWRARQHNLRASRELFVATSDACLGRTRQYKRDTLVKLAALERKATQLKADVGKVEVSIDKAKAEIMHDLGEKLDRLNDKMDRLGKKMEQKVDMFTPGDSCLQSAVRCTAEQSADGCVQEMMQHGWLNPPVFLPTMLLCLLAFHRVSRSQPSHSVQLCGVGQATSHETLVGGHGQQLGLRAWVVGVGEA
jgi:hypothetical protein